MAITFLAAAQEVARLVGGSAVTAQQTIAKTAIKDALRDFDGRHDWEFKLATLNDITVVSGTATYDLVSLGGGTRPKKIYSARLKTDKWVLQFVRQREWDRIVWNQESPGAARYYTEVRSANGNLTIKLFPTPNSGETLQVRVFEHIVIPSADGDTLDIPDRYIPAVLSLGRYYFLIDRDGEDQRAPVYLQKAEQLIQKAIQDDVGMPDEDIHFTPASEWAPAYRDPITDDLW